MIRKKIKNIVLLVMVLVCVHLSSYVWLQLPDFISSADTEDNVPEEIIVADIWEVVRPIKNIIKYKDNYTVTYTDKYDMWGKTVHIIEDAFNDYDKSSVTESAVFPSEYLKFDFSTYIPSDIFTGYMQLNNAEINKTVKNVKNVIIDLQNTKSLYFYDGFNTVKIEGDSIDTSELLDIIKNFDFESETKFSFDQKIGDETVQVPVPLEVSALNPVFVQSELDVFDTYRINEIAKDYFKSNYDYVRKSVEVSGNLVYTYRTEKVLKINEEGLLDFYDAAFDTSNVTDQYESFAAAVNFTEEFLGFPKDVYLSNLESIQHEGNYGYRYTFSYKILERPILFSKVRENTALQIDVVGNKVRNIDDSQMDKMNDTQILPAVEVIKRNIDTGEEESETAEGIVSEIKPIKTEMIKDINNIYLGYFDLARISREQMLRVVWVIETNDKSYIFNATTGALIEEW
jgi:hypothetical protein